jgi:hypothetical protein
MFHVQHEGGAMSKFFMVKWRNLCEEAIAVKAESPEQALRLAMDGLGEVSSSVPIQSISYCVYADCEEPCIVADGLGEVLVSA